MKSCTHLMLFVAAAVMLTGCDQPSEPPATAVSSSPSAPAHATPLPEVIPKAVAELEKRAEVDRQLRVKAETRFSEQETATSQWQSGALLAVTGAVVLLIVGTILGTRARRDAKN